MMHPLQIEADKKSLVKLEVELAALRVALERISGQELLVLGKHLNNMLCHDDSEYARLLKLHGQQVIGGNLVCLDDCNHYPSVVSVCIKSDYSDENSELQNFLELYKNTGEIRYFHLAKKIVDLQKSRILLAISKLSSKCKLLRKRIQAVVRSYNVRLVRNLIRTQFKTQDDNSGHNEFVNTPGTQEATVYKFEKLNYHATTSERTLYHYNR